MSTHPSQPQVGAGHGSAVLPLILWTPGTSFTGYMAARCRTTDADVYVCRNWRDHGWTGKESRVDGEGRRWSREIDAVVNDYGDLVEVPA